MKILAVTLISLSLFASVASHAQTSTTKAPTSSLIKIVRSDSLQSNKGSAQYFTGSVQVQQLFPAYDPSRTSGGKVTFEAGARSANIGVWRGKAGLELSIAPLPHACSLAQLVGMA